MIDKLHRKIKKYIDVVFLIGSPLRSYISSAIIKLNEDGIIQRLKTKWWKKENGGECTGSLDSSEAASASVNELGLPNVGGIFLVLLIGLMLGCVMAAIETFWKKFTKGRKFLT